MSQWRLVSASRIDSDRWDACVRSRNREIFSEYWYWNTVCDSWQAWVMGDYEDVIALPTERKWGIVPFMRTPLYVKWLEGDPNQLRQLIQSFFGFRRVHVPFEMEGAQERVYQKLILDSNWQPSKELAKNIRKAEAESPEYVESVDWQCYSDFMKQNHPYEWPATQQLTMKKLLEVAAGRGVGKIAGVRMKGEWAAMQFYIHDTARACLIQNVVSNSWRNREPMPFLLSTLFHDWMQREHYVHVNFMGSNNPGVARFNEKFGAESFRYWEYPG